MAHPGYFQKELKKLRSAISLGFIFLLIFSVYFYSQKFKTHKDDIDVPKSLITLRGTLRLKLFPGPPEYSSVEDGDREDNTWIVELDGPSFLIALNAPTNELTLDLDDVLKWENAHSLTLCLDENFKKVCEECKDHDVIVSGDLFHAHTTHHHTPLLMSPAEILRAN